jgi:RNA polymerase sigma factor (TIGR02999 family)
MTTEEDLTSLLIEATRGVPSDRLFELVYDELREAAERQFRREARDQTLQPTALVHEAYLRMVDQDRVEWQGRTHFKAIAARMMRRILIDRARSRGRAKRGGSWQRVTLSDAFQLTEGPEIDVEALEQALSRMAELDQRQAQVLEFRLFGDLSVEETARMLDVSERTVLRDWKMGTAWLRRELETTLETGVGFDTD